jgi:shikimate dehydrogenase
MKDDSVRHRSRESEDRSSRRDRSILVALIGAGIQASRTPLLHEREGAAQDLAYVYRVVDLAALGLGADALPEIVAAAERFAFDGLNVTHPCKQAVIPLLDELSPDAAAIGAVNTVVFTNGRRIGHNTDWWGFAESFKRELQGAARDRVVQLGAGGAGAAVAHALLTLGIGQVLIKDLEQSRAADLATELCKKFGEGRAAACVDLERGLRAAHGLVNTTPVGMTKYPGMPMSQDLLRKELWVADIVYFPLETELLRAARALGCRTMSGGGMAVFQAVAAFQHFTGIEPDAERMLRHFATM